MTIADKLFSFRGRIGRADFIRGILFCTGVGLVLDKVPDEVPDAVFAVLLLAVVGLKYVEAAVVVKRLRDLNWSGYFAIGIVGLDIVASLLLTDEDTMPAGIGLGLIFIAVSIVLACIPSKPAPAVQAHGVTVQAPPGVTVQVIVQQPAGAVPSA